MVFSWNERGWFYGTRTFSGIRLYIYIFTSYSVARNRRYNTIVLLFITQYMQTPLGLGRQRNTSRSFCELIYHLNFFYSSTRRSISHNSNNNIVVRKHESRFVLRVRRDCNNFHRSPHYYVYLYIYTEISRTHSIWHLTGPPIRRPSSPSVPDFPLKHNGNVKFSI